VPTFVDIAGGPKGDGLKKRIKAGEYPGIVETTLDGFDQRDYLEGKSAKSARDFFFYFSGATPSAVRYKNWKMYYTMSQPRALDLRRASRTRGRARQVVPISDLVFETLSQNRSSFEDRRAHAPLPSSFQVGVGFLSKAVGRPRRAGS